MYRIFCLLALLTFFSARPLQASPADSSGLRISLLTGGVGDELYASFGHSALRVTDSIAGTDRVFNYGTFNFYEEGFELKFMRGKLLYYLSEESFPDFMTTFVAEQRSVQEQVLQLSGADKQELYAFLLYNLEPENRSYKYDFLFDNCATRIRDIFPARLGAGFRFAESLKEPMSFRDMINRYLYRKHWERFGIDLLLGRPVDRQMDSYDAMFLPDYLRDGVGGGSLDGQPVSGAAVTLLPGAPPQDAGMNGPLLLNLGLALLTILGLILRPLRLLGRFMSLFLMGITGLLGCLMLFMWLGTDHQACQDNFNVLWALPTNVAMLFGRRKGRSRYALIALVLLLLSLILHITGIQQLPLTELWPLLAALSYVYLKIWRQPETHP